MALVGLVKEYEVGRKRRKKKKEMRRNEEEEKEERSMNMIEMRYHMEEGAASLGQRRNSRGEY